MMLTYEQQLHAQFANVRCTEERLTGNFTRYTVWIGDRPVSDSGDRAVAFMHAVHDIRDGLLRLGPSQGQEKAVAPPGAGKWDILGQTFRP